MKKSALKIYISVLIFYLFPLTLSAQEALKSVEEEYYDFLSLNGVVERPTLGYRTLSDSVWNFKEVESFEENEDGTFTKVRADGAESDANIWKKNNLGTRYTLWQASSTVDNWFMRGINQGLVARVYGPEWFNSYNTAAPYGQNDGALWQGRGYNTALTAGVRLEGYGFELTFKPQVSWMQNREFEYIKPAYSGENFKNKADTYGYYGVPSIDAPQRFGDSSFWTYDWGDTEVRWSWKSFTTGFGTQAIWLGPAKINPIIHSNNAASYPKFDIGLRKTKLTMPYFGWDLGYFEARAWWGKLTESDWFDNDDGNDNNLISGLSISYEFPGILHGFSVGLNRTMLSKWSDITPYALFTIMVPGMTTTAGHDQNDQRASITFDYLIDKFSFEIYLEWARNDYTSGGIVPILQYPFHTEAWTFGLTKSFMIKNLRFNILYEYTKLECSQDYDRVISWSSTFYAHHIITQGYTNKGQTLGAGIGTGGNCHYLGFDIYTTNNKLNFFISRTNPDLDYTWYIDSKTSSYDAEKSIKVYFDFGFSVLHFFTPSFYTIFGYTGDLIINKLNNADPDRHYDFNNILRLQINYNF